MHQQPRVGMGRLLLLRCIPLGHPKSRETWPQSPNIKAKGDGLRGSFAREGAGFFQGPYDGHSPTAGVLLGARVLPRCRRLSTPSSALHTGGFGVTVRNDTRKPRFELSALYECFQHHLLASGNRLGET